MVGYAVRLVQLAHVRVLRPSAHGLQCIVSGRETFIPFAQIYEPPLSRLLPGEVATLTVPESFVRELDWSGENRRSESRHPVGPCEPLWLFCKDRGVGGQVALRDASLHGLGVAVTRRNTWRLIEALRDARDQRTPVELFRVANNRNHQARVAWLGEGAAYEMLIGLSLEEPLGAWAKETLGAY